MKLSTGREALLKPLQAVIGVVERRQTLPILGNLLVVTGKDRLEITATDLEVEIKAGCKNPIKETGQLTLPARKLLDICKALPDGAKIELSTTDSRVQIKSGRSRFSLSTLPANDFPVVEKIKGQTRFSIRQCDLRNLIERTNFSMAQQDVRYYLNGLLLELTSGRIRAVATDGHRLATCDTEVEISSPGKQQVIVPRKAIQELLRILQDSEEPVDVEVGGNHIRLNTKELCFTSKLVDGRFPDYERVIPKGGDKHVFANRELLRQALNRTSILSNEKYRGIRLNLEKNIMKIQAHNPDQEEADEEFEVDYKGNELEIGFNVTYLLDILTSIPSEQVEITLSDSNSSCLIEQPGTDSYRYVVMPIRL